MKVTIISIHIQTDWEDIDIENDIVDVSVKTNKGYYALNLATPKHIKRVMDNEETNYYGPCFPFIIVNRLTPEIIEQAVEAFAEDGGVLVKNL